MNEYKEITIGDFFERELYHKIDVVLINGIYYNEISDFRKIKMRKHGKYQIFFHYKKNNKKELKAMNLDKIIMIKNEEYNKLQ
jgi:hypothetical protein